MLYTQPAGTRLHPVIFNGCQELLKLQEMRGRNPPEIKYEFDIESGRAYPQLSEPDPTADDQPTIKPTIKKPTAFSTTDTGTSTQDINALNDVCAGLYDDCDGFHDCAGVLG